MTKTTQLFHGEHDDDDGACVFVCVCLCKCFMKCALRLIFVGAVFGLMAAFLELNEVYLIHVIDIFTKTHAHTGIELMCSLRACEDWWLMVPMDPFYVFSLLKMSS